MPLRYPIIVLFAAQSAFAQADYANLDAARPLRVQDAYAIERYGWDLQFGPAASWPGNGGTTSALDVAIAWGALPRTQFELAAPIASVPAAGGRSSGLDGLEFGALYGLNRETLSLPALAVAARYAAPVGSLAPEGGLLTLEGLATRSWPGFRVHVNAAVTIGPSEGGTGALERSRWFAGAAVDHAWPLSSFLLAGEIVALQPLAAGSPLSWSAGAGMRWQWTPRLVLDAGVERRFAGDDLAWSATVGLTWAFAVRAFIPVPR
jgi:hypothetical protein